MCRLGVVTADRAAHLFPFFLRKLLRLQKNMVQWHSCPSRANTLAGRLFCAFSRWSIKESPKVAKKECMFLFWHPMGISSFTPCIYRAFGDFGFLPPFEFWHSLAVGSVQTEQLPFPKPRLTDLTPRASFARLTVRTENPRASAAA